MVNIKRTVASAFLCALLAAGFPPAAVLAHPNAACKVSSHQEVAATSETEAFTNPKTAGYGNVAIVIFDTNGGQLRAVTATAPANPELVSYGWEMSAVFPFGPIALGSAVPNTAQIAVQNATGIFVVTYVEPGGSVVRARTLESTLAAPGPAVQIGTNLSPNVATLAGGISGFFYAQVAGSVLTVYRSVTGTTWTLMDSSDASASFNGPMASTVDEAGNYFLLYHHGANSLAFASAARGSDALVARAVPPVPGVNIAVASSAVNTLMVIGNAAGNIRSSITTDGGVSWQAVQLVETTANVDDGSVVGLARTQYKWVAVWIGQSKLNVEFRAVLPAFPTAADWANVSKSNFFTGSAGAGLAYQFPNFVGTDGDGFALAASDNVTFDITFRSCYDVPSGLVAATQAPGIITDPVSGPLQTLAPTRSGGAVAFPSAIVAWATITVMVVATVAV